MKRSIVTVNVFNIVWNDEEFYKFNDDMVLDLPNHINSLALEVVYDLKGNFDEAVQDKISEYLTDTYLIDVEEYDWEIVCEEEHDM